MQEGVSGDLRERLKSLEAENALLRSGKSDLEEELQNVKDLQALDQAESHDNLKKELKELQSKLKFKNQEVIQIRSELNRDNALLRKELTQAKRNSHRRSGSQQGHTHENGMHNDFSSKFDRRFDQTSGVGKPSRPAIDLTVLSDEPPRKAARGTSNQMRSSKPRTTSHEEDQKDKSFTLNGEGHMNATKDQGAKAFVKDSEAGRTNQSAPFQPGPPQFVAVLPLLRYLETKVRALTHGQGMRQGKVEAKLRESSGELLVSVTALVTAVKEACVL